MKKDIGKLNTLLKLFISLICLTILNACNYNPFLANNRTTGNPTTAVVGAGVGVGVVGLLGGTKPMMALAGIGGGALTYYLTSLRNDAWGIYQAGGQVYVLGQYVGIYIPTDNLFDYNTADFIPGYRNTLDSVVAVLQLKK